MSQFFIHIFNLVSSKILQLGIRVFLLFLFFKGLILIPLICTNIKGAGSGTKSED